jgi:UDP-galactopyranose mutase
VSVTTPVPRARRADLVVLSHLRWGSVYQRPHHLMSRASREGRVYWVEEPVVGSAPGIGFEHVRDGLSVVVPVLPEGHADGPETVARLLGEVLAAEDVDAPVLWYYTPLAQQWTRAIEPLAVVYDCMDELSGFAGAPPLLPILETKLLMLADLVFTGGRSLYEAKRNLARSVHLFPSSVDAEHFRVARQPIEDPADQRHIPRPRIGFAGVIDERMDRRLLADLAALRPDWSFVLVGPVMKIEDSVLPRGDNLHYLGQRPYEQLPAYLSGWDAGILPFALNDATRFISPTKVPEYLAAGLPVVSTPIRDVVRPYEQLRLARIGGSAAEFAAAIDEALREDRGTRLAAADKFLARTSWDRTWREMSALVDEVVAPRTRPSALLRPAPGTSPAAAEAS